MKPLFSRIIVTVLLMAFLVITALGIWLIFDSVGTSKGSTLPTAQENIEITASASGVKIKMSTAFPGVIMFLVGGSGLLLMLMKVPIKQVVGCQQKPFGCHYHHFAALATFGSSPPQPILNDEIEKIPLLLWFFIRNKRRAVRVAV